MILCPSAAADFRHTSAAGYRVIPYRDFKSLILGTLRLRGYESRDSRHADALWAS